MVNFLYPLVYIIVVISSVLIENIPQVDAIVDTTPGSNSLPLVSYTLPYSGLHHIINTSRYSFKIFIGGGVILGICNVVIPTGDFILTIVTY